MDGIKIPVVEIFNSISGEGISSGSLVSFVRVAECNLRCTYCDTTYSYDKNAEGIRMMTPVEIADELRGLRCNQVICTGGEPLEHGKAKRLLPLYLASEGFEVRIETNGSCLVYSKVELHALTGNVNRTSLFYSLDVKCPGSGVVGQDRLKENVEFLSKGDEIKFVIGSRLDFDYAMSVVSRYKVELSASQAVLCFSPVHGLIEPREIVGMMQEQGTYFQKYGIQARLSLQIHKVIWPADMRGV